MAPGGGAEGGRGSGNASLRRLPRQSRAGDEGFRYGVRRLPLSRRVLYRAGQERVRARIACRCRVDGDGAELDATYLGTDAKPAIPTAGRVPQPAAVLGLLRREGRL